MSSKSIYIYGSSTFVTSDDKYHYTYRITNIQENKHYYGVRTTKVDPYSDLGTEYFSSSKILRPIVKQNPELFKFKILKCFKTRKEAMAHEIFLHSKFEVSKNKNFYNLAKQTSSGFAPEGIKYITNGKRNKVINPGDPIPMGWTIGRVILNLSVNRKSTKDTFCITNGIKTKRIGISEPIPEGWQKGRTGNSGLNGSIWITNGTKNRKIHKSEIIEDGWWKGRIGDAGKTHRNTLWITDGTINSKLAPGSKMPEGWRLGRSDKGTGKLGARKNSFYITDGHINKKLNFGDEIPQGFRKGRTLIP